MIMSLPSIILRNIHMNIFKQTRRFLFIRRYEMCPKDGEGGGGTGGVGSGGGGRSGPLSDRKDALEGEYFHRKVSRLIHYYIIDFRLSMDKS